MDSFVNIPGVTTWKAPVANAAALPTSGNRAGDARVTLDTSQIYIWDGVSAWVLASGTTVNSFTTFQTPAGTYPVADSSTDTMTFTSSNSSITITGNSTTDTIDFISNIGAAGSNTQVQYNDSGVFGADANFTWNKTTKLLTLTNSALASTPTLSELLTNTTAATTGSRIQVSPAVQFQGNGWRTQSGGSTRSLSFRNYVAPTTGTAEVIGNWILEYSLNGATNVEALRYKTTMLDGTSFPRLEINGGLKSSVSNSSTLGTLQNVDLVNPTGTRTNLAWTFGSTIRAGFQVESSGTVNFKSTGSQVFNFDIGSSIDTTSYVVQIYSGGVFTNQNGFFGNKVTSGSSDTGTGTTLSSYGSFAVKGILVTSSTYTIGASETMIYVDASNSTVCSGTPTACSTYGNEGACNTHSGVGCSWFAGNACSAFSGSDEGTCEGNSGCTWEELSCGGASNTDQTTCETQDDSYGGNCTWDTGLCSTLAADEATCEAQSGCTWNSLDCHAFDGQSQGSCEINLGCSWVGGDCHTFDGTDSGTCETGHTGCSWDGSLCNGTYDEASLCNGVYDTSCTGNICTGNYNTGNCNGTYGEACQGTANCGLLVSSGTCAAEAGCSWGSGITLTLPAGSLANRNNTSRLYSIMNIGGSGTVIVLPNAEDTLQSSITLSTQYSEVLLHHHNVIAACSVYNSDQSTCESTSGCSWTPAVVCSDYNGDQSACESNGCTWEDPNCTGAGSASSCNGTYTSIKRWFKHNTIS